MSEWKLNFKPKDKRGRWEKVPEVLESAMERETYPKAITDFLIAEARIVYTFRLPGIIRGDGIEFLTKEYQEILGNNFRMLSVEVSGYGDEQWTIITLEFSVTMTETTINRFKDVINQMLEGGK